VLHILSCAVKIYRFLNCDQKVTDFICSIDITRQLSWYSWDLQLAYVIPGSVPSLWKCDD